MVVMIIMQNSNGEFLLQKRSELKGGKWAFTGGYPKTGESSLEGIISEVREELGIDISLENITLMKSNVFDKVIGDIYYVNMEYNFDSFSLQKEEVSDVMLATYEDILNMIKNGEFFKTHGKVFMDLINDNHCKKIIKML
ncbi:MAG: NUDIX domain-containing protein [Bacilli bacterium]|nr:NUDIX domain-containing protein [Bacilli bacterium]